MDYYALNEHTVYPRSGSIARRVGASKYFTGHACGAGHIAPRYSYNGVCIQCARIATAEHRSAPAGRATARRSYERIRKNEPERIIWYSAKTRARKLGLAFDISASDIKAVWPADGICPAIGIQLIHNHRDDSRACVHDNSPTLDRLVPKLGYVKGNIMVISQLANKIKNNETDPAVFRKVADYIERNLKGA